MREDLDFPASEAAAREERAYWRYVPLFLVAFALGMVCGAGLANCR